MMHVYQLPNMAQTDFLDSTTNNSSHGLPNDTTETNLFNEDFVLYQ